MKKLLAIFSAVAAIGLTAACAGGNTTTTTTTPTTANPTTTTSIPTSSAPTTSASTTTANPTTSAPTTSTPTTSTTTTTTIEPQALAAPVIALEDDTVSWNPVENAEGYIVSINNDEKPLQVETEYSLSNLEQGEYEIKVMATTNNSNFINSPYSNTVSYTVSSVVELSQTTVYLVGDSTVCSFNDTTYYYPRYGYGTQLANYLAPEAKITNLALSGRSSKSYIQEANYTTLKNSIKEGDYLIIGFGHNDEKADDPTRYSEPFGSKEDEGSFKYNLYNYYIKLANDAKATPILCTPIVRADSNNNYTGTSGHVTNGADYSEVIKSLGSETNTTVIDLTAKTKELYTRIGYDEAIKFHAWTNSNKASVDKTHVNIYGAKMVAYLLASELKNTSSTLRNYVLSDITAPTEADLVVNPSYVESDYTAPALESYAAPDCFKTLTDGWYGTAFGDTGGNPQTSGYIANELADGSFEVGQSAASNKGKIGSTEGIAFLFQQVSVSKNFKLTADVLVKSEKNTTQAGFGLMLRDDAYINLTTSDSTILSNYVAAGMYLTSAGRNIIYSRENSKLVTSGNSLAGNYATGDTAKLSIERIGQVVNCKVEYLGKTYTETYTDFDFVAIDNNYMYIGMYATRGTVATFTNVSFTITGDAIGA